MKNLSRITLIAFVIGAGALLAAIAIQRPKPPLSASLAPLFQVLGRGPKSMDRALSRLLPADQMDEKAYGEALVARYATDNPTADEKYLNDVFKPIAAFAKKPFVYRVFVYESSEPNAFALPGGVIFVTEGLLAQLKSERELVAILSHELGHIERGHCFDAVKLELSAQKIGVKSVGEIADFALAVLTRHSFSKTQEDEADEYGYELLQQSAYDPRGAGKAFQMLEDYMNANGMGEDQKANPVRDYFSSHPPIAVRRAKFQELARVWWLAHPTEKRYVGILNLEKRAAMSAAKLPEEYVGAVEPAPQ